MNHLKLAPLVGLLFLLPACNRDGQEPISSSAEEENETPSNRIDIPPIVRSNLGLTFAKVERRNVVRFGVLTLRYITNKTLVQTKQVI